MTEELVGQIEHITFTNEENGYTIARVRVSGRFEPVTIVGNLLAPTPGESLRMTGEWIQHPQYGDQFRVDKYVTAVPATPQGIRKYLGSGMIKGLGPVMAKRIVKQFGRNTIDILEKNIDRLAEVDGIGQKRVTMIRKAWEEQKDIRNVMIFLQAHGVSSGYATKIFKQYGDRSIAVVKQNPYRLASDIFGIGFKIADQIAHKLDFPSDSDLRVAAGILYVLDLMAGEGHVYLPYGKLLSECSKVLKVAPKVVEQAIGNLSRDHLIVIDKLITDQNESSKNEKAVYLTRFHVCETGIADRLRIIKDSPRSTRPLHVKNALAWVQRRLAIHLAGEQVDAITSALIDKISVITGGPGTGKTTIINAILQIYQQMGARVLLAAPTGRAAKRMSETCARNASTIHRMLEFNLLKGGFQRNDKKPLNCDLLVIDEASMVDTLLMYHLMKAVPPGATLVLVGDVNQLPSVGAGNVLKDVIESGTVAVVELTTIFRQAKHSRIVVNAHRINSGLQPEWSEITPSDPSLSDFYFIQQEDPDKVLNIILALAKKRIPRRFGLDSVNDIQVITPMHRGVVGSDNLNIQLQEALNPTSERVVRGDRELRINDKVMQIRNDYSKDVFNGDIGRIERIEPTDQQVIIRFDDRDVTYSYSDLDQIVLAFAVSVHKSQGSEYPAVVIPLLTQHYLLLQRNLVYTAITRGRQLVVMVGTRKALAMAIGNSKTDKRHTHLKERLFIAFKQKKQLIR
jgi:exodeoxyribonuclease V alpha subunit